MKKEINFKNLSRLKNNNYKNKDKIWYVNIMKGKKIVKKY
jgi:hypothetical protein